MLRFLDKNYKAIAFDIDGTLLKSNHTISINTLHIICEIKDEIHITLVSARPLLSVCKIAKQIGCFGMMVGANGGVIFNDDQEIFIRNSLDTFLVEQIIEICSKDSRISYSLYSGDDWITPHIDTRIKNEANILGFYPTKITSLLEKGERIEKILLISDPKDENSVRELLKPFQGKVNISFSKAGYCEINAFNITKASSLKWIANQSGIPLHEWIAFGDGENDIPMICSCGLGVAMGNAKNRLKEEADLIISTNDEEGIYYFLKNHIQF
jgi:5-amino-6-(5-phospho-D-ribitylamino)uracil phosphatase